MDDNVGSKTTWVQRLNYIKKLKEVLKNFLLFETPDLLVCNTSGNFCTLELKVTKGNKLRFSPHQIAFHKRHPKNTFIMVKALGPGTIKLFEGRYINDLLREGFKFQGACCLELDACSLYLSKLGA